MRSKVTKVVALALVVAGAAVGLRFYLEQPPDPGPAAAAVASGLAALDLGEVPVAGLERAEATAQLQAAAAGMDGLRPSVSVGEVQENEDSTQATAAMEVVWDLDDSANDWTYTTTATLTRGEEDWALAWAPSLLEPSLAAGERLALTEVAPERGEILGADGAVLVTDRSVLRAGIDKTKVAPEQAGASADALATLLEIDRAAYAAQVQQAGPQAFVEALVLRNDESLDVDTDAASAITGVALLPDEIPLAPTRTFARPLLGSVGQATAEMIEASDGALQAGDITGLSGLQSAYDAQLRGEPGLAVRIAPPDGSGGSAREVFTREPVAGQPITTTLDQGQQVLAEQVLAPVGPPSAIVAIRPSTGQVLAAASGPGSGGYSTATSGRYAPGSTFKVVSALALLRSGLTPTSTLACTPTTTVDGRSFKNYDDYPASALGDIALRQVIANSCNTALVQASAQVPQSALADAAAALGVGADYDPGVPAFTGAVPTTAPATEHAASMIGQGRVEASPLSMATVAASIAAGQRVSPRIIEDAAPATSSATPPASAEEGEQLQALMRAVVTEGSATFLDDVPGEPIGAKTGTAEYGTEKPLRTHAWMIAIRGDLAVAVFVEDGASGSKTAGPLLEQFLRAAAITAEEFG